ncbi:MAG: hypothetical protein AB1798_01845 [Spirochaetota bacterium]
MIETSLNLYDRNIAYCRLLGHEVPFGYCLVELIQKAKGKSGILP